MTDDTPSSTLTLSPRDVQWLAAMMTIGATLVNPMTSDDDLAHNFDALYVLFDRHYSGTEGEALTARLRALLPTETPVQFVTVLRPLTGWIQ